MAFAAAFAGPVRQLASILAMGMGILLVLGAAGWWAGNPWFGHVVAGMVAGLLLGRLLVRQPVAWLAGAYGAVALVAFAGGALVVGAAPIAAWIEAAGVMAGALIAYGLLHARQVEPAGLHELASFARTAAVGAVVLPLCLVGVVGLAAPAFDLPGLGRAWLAGAVGVLAMLPLVLAWPKESGGQSSAGQLPEHWHERLLLATLAWLPVPAVLWWRPGLLVLGLLPLVAVAARLGPRATAWLGLLTGIAVAAFGILAAASNRVAPDIVALPAAAALLVALAIAILAAQRDRTARALTAANEHLRAVTEHGPTLVATLDMDLRHRFANDGNLKWLGKNAGEVLGQTL